MIHARLLSFLSLSALVVLSLSALVVSCGVAPAQAPAVSPAPATEVWQTTLGLKNPLIGRIWDVSRKAFVTRDELFARLAQAEFVLLGEKHDNPDHHRLQARTVRALVSLGKHPEVAFEMIEIDQQALIDGFLAQKPQSAAGLGASVKWDDRGWPTWGDYEPIAQAAVDAHLPIVAANLPHAEARAVVHEGLGALTREGALKLGLDKPLPADAAASLTEELKVSHCGHLPDEMIGPMALAQRARDATMASVLLGNKSLGAVLIAGAGHARTDRGVPFALRQGKPDATIASVAFVEVEDALTEPSAYAERFGTKTLPFDFVWFTPRANDDDPCEKFKKKP